ncbi:MAG: ABC transporter permease [Abditibacteriales bacterium]|nr:ABC transporter permease [Abditibacteriales bacterium]
MDLILTTALHNLRWVGRRRFFGYLIFAYVGVMGIVLLFLGWTQPVAPVRHPLLVFALGQGLCACLIAFFWTRVTIRRDARIGRLAEVLLTGCDAWELVVARTLVGFGISVMLLLTTLPLQCLAASMDSLPAARLGCLNLTLIAFIAAAAALGEFTESQTLGSRVQGAPTHFPSWIVLVYVATLGYLLWIVLRPLVGVMGKSLSAWQAALIGNVGAILNPKAALLNAATPGEHLWLGSIAFYGVLSGIALRFGVSALRKHSQAFWQDVMPDEISLGEHAPRRRETFPRQVSPEVKRSNPVYAVSQFYARHHAPTVVEWLFFAIYTIPATLYAFSVGKPMNLFGASIVLVGMFILTLIPTLVAALDIAKEREMKTLELLLATPLTNREIVLAKASAALRPLAPFALYFFDCALMLAAGQVISWVAVLHVLVAMVIYPFTCVLVGLTFSLLCRSSVESTTCAFAFLTLPGVAFLLAPHISAQYQVPTWALLWSPLHAMLEGLRYDSEKGLIVWQLSLVVHVVLSGVLVAVMSWKLRQWALKTV